MDTSRASMVWVRSAGWPAKRRSASPCWSRPGRDAVLIEYFSDTVFPRIRNLGYDAVRTARWKLIHYREIAGADELYDLRRDPFELDPRIGDRRAGVAQLKARLRGLLRETGAGVVDC